MNVRRALSTLVDEFQDKELLLHASAIAFRVLIAAIPATLFVIAVLGSLGLDELWREEAAPALRENVSNAVYVLVDDAVTRVLESQSGFWITIGAVLAAIAMASVVDAVTRTLNRIHGAEETRAFGERAANTIAIGALAGLLFLVAIATVSLGTPGIEAVLGDGVVGSVIGFVVPWAIAAALLILAVMLIVRVAPDIERPARRVGIGAAITVAGWILMSILFGLYLELVADYGSIFGNLATAYLLVQYVALSTIVFVAGLLVDAITAGRRRFGDGRGG